MGAEGMVSLIAIIVLVFPLAAATISETHRDTRQLQINLSNLEGIPDEETVEVLYANSVEDEQITSPNSVPKRRKLVELDCIEETREENDHLYLEHDIEPIPFMVSKAPTAGGGGGIDTITIIIVVVSTSVVTFLLASLFFCWYTRTYGGPKVNEKPLINRGSSHAYSLQNSSNDLQNTTNPDQQKTDISLGIPLDQPPGTAPLKPPPGRPDLALKTPPGRKDLSVHLPTANTSSPPNRSPVGLGNFPSPPGKGPANRRAPSARRAPSSRRPPAGGAPPPPPPVVKPPPPGPPPPPAKKGPAPPPPPSGGKGPPQPPGGGLKGARAAAGPGDPDGDDANKAKLKPFFWDKVMASPDQAMVWNQIRAGSFQFNEEMIENLFGYNAAAEKNKGAQKKSSSSQDSSSNFVQIIDAKKAQNLSILLKALNVTTNEVCDALKEGNELPVELIQTLIKMAPTGEEELKLRLYNGDISQLGTAERFLKQLVEIPFAYKRLESLLFMCTLQEEQDTIKESFQTLEGACKELKKSRLFLKLLEAVLKTGNRMNDGTFRGSAQAFKLDTLLKLSDVKGVDGKTTLLHFVVLEIVRAEGIRAAKTAQETGQDLEESDPSQDSDEYYQNLGLQVVTDLSDELEDVKKAAILDADGLTGTVSRLGQALVKAREFLNTDLKNIDNGDDDNDDDDDDEVDDEFAVILTNFVQDAEKDVMWMLEEEKRIMALVKDTGDYFHGKPGKDEGLRLFVIVRDFLLIVDKICKEIKSNPIVRPSKKKDGSPSKTTAESQTDDVPEGKTAAETDNGSGRKTTAVETEDASERKTTANTGDLEGKKLEKEVSQEIREISNIVRDTIDEIDDSRNEIAKNDDSQPKTKEIDDSKKVETRDTDDLKHETRENDDLKPEIREKDVEETSKKSVETQQAPLRMPHERLIPAIAMRRVDTFSSSSGSDEDT